MLYLFHRIKTRVLKQGLHWPRKNLVDCLLPKSFLHCPSIYVNTSNNILLWTQISKWFLIYESFTRVKLEYPFISLLKCVWLLCVATGDSSSSYECVMVGGKNMACNQTNMCLTTNQSQYFIIYTLLMPALNLHMNKWIIDGSRCISMSGIEWHCNPVSHIWLLLSCESIKYHN